MGLDLIVYWKTIFFAITKDIVLFKIYFKSLVFSKQHSSSEICDCQWQKPSSVTQIFIALTLSNYKNTSMLWFHIY